MAKKILSKREMAGFLQDAYWYARHAIDPTRDGMFGKHDCPNRSEAMRHALSNARKAGVKLLTSRRTILNAPALLMWIETFASEQGIDAAGGVVAGE